MVLVQAGHLHISQNCSPDLRSGTGAPDEVDWTPGVAAAIVAHLAQAKVDARLIDANFNCDPQVGQDYAAVVAIHYQADLPTASGFYVGPGDPAQDGSAQASQRLADLIHARYVDATGLTFQPGWDNANIRHYYLFEKLSGPTPFALIECGVGAPGAPDHDFLWSDTGRQTVANAISAGILDFVGRPTPPSPPSVNLAAQLADCQSQVTSLRAQLKQDVATLLADCQSQMASLRAQCAQDVAILKDVVAGLPNSYEKTSLLTTLDAMEHLLA